MKIDKRIMKTAFECREAEQEQQKQRTLSGIIYYSKDSEDFFFGFDGEEFREQILAGAFADSVNNADIYALWSHDSAQVLGSTRSGSLSLTDTPVGLAFSIQMPDTTVGRDVWEMTKRGDVSGVSFGMIVLEDDIQTSKKDGVTIHTRTIKKAKLIEISPVAFPAYPDNELAARSMRDRILKRTTKTADEQEQEMMLRLQLS